MENILFSRVDPDTYMDQLAFKPMRNFDYYDSYARVLCEGYTNKKSILL